MLCEREEEPSGDRNSDFNAHCLGHHGSSDLAMFTVYTQSRTPAESCAEILMLAAG